MQTYSKKRVVGLLGLMMGSMLTAAPAGQRPLLAHATPTPAVIPTVYQDGHFYAKPIMQDGAPLYFILDTGADSLINRDVAQRFQLPITKVHIDKQQTVDETPMPPFQPRFGIPPPTKNGGRLIVMDSSVSPLVGGKDAPQQDGVLGQSWFAGRVWTFDYPGRRLLLRPPGDLPQVPPQHRVPLGFQTDKAGIRTTGFPRLQATIDGEKIDFLFDTGAETRLTPNAVASLNDQGPTVRATSFIILSTLRKWHRHHPDWRIIQHAEAGTDEPMIEVPQVTVGGYTVGPVWFTDRADANFHPAMSQYMDKEIDGALGGSCFQYLRITLDYPKAVAVFEHP